MANSIDFETISSISIFLGGAVAHSAIGVTFIHGRISTVTEKAIKVVSDNDYFIWLPKKALIISDSGNYFKLARWFKFDRRQGQIVDRMISVGGISSSQE